jgi:hypothetical protein
MESYLKVIKSLSPAIAFPSYDSFIENLNREEMEWFDTFRTHITERIVREDFAPMFDRNVRSLMPLETIAALIILAEGYGWSDSQTVNECCIDVRLRHALGINDATEVPSLAMLNGFRAMVDGHRRNSGTDIMLQVKERVTTEKGPVRRLDSGRLMLWAMRVA